MNNEQHESHLIDRKQMRYLKVIWTMLLMGVIALVFSGCTSAQLKQTEEIAKNTAAVIAGELVSHGRSRLDVELDKLEGRVRAPIETWRYKHLTVVKDDTLWDLSASDGVYGDPFMWPLIYKKNRDQIQDPDLIEIGWRLDYLTNYTRKDREAAQRAARHYGE